MLEAGRKPIRILLIDDHALFRESVARLLASETDFEIVDSCGSVEGALEVLQRASIDVALLDFYFEECDGKKFIHLAREHGFLGKILLVTAGVNDSDMGELVRAGISGIFLKRDSSELLAQAIRHVIAGRVWFEQEHVIKVVERRASARSAVSKMEFTEREQVVLSCLFEGFTNKKIAQEIGVSTGSIKATLQQLFSKAGVRTRSQLVRFASERTKARF